MGIALETGRIGFRPAGTWAGGALNTIIGVAIMSGIVYGMATWAPVSNVYETGRLLDYLIMAVQCAFIAITFSYLLPWLFTAIGSAESNLSELPDISLNNFA